MKIREAKLDKLCYKLKNLFTRGRNPENVRGFIQGICNKIYRTLIGECKHFFQTLRQFSTSGLSRAAIVSRMKT